MNGWIDPLLSLEGGPPCAEVFYCGFRRVFEGEASYLRQNDETVIDEFRSPPLGPALGYDGVFLAELDEYRLASETLAMNGPVPLVWRSR